MSTRVSPPGPLEIGSTVDLVCEANVGDKPITFLWTDSSGMVVSPSDTDGTISVVFTSAMEYTCTASNSVGMDTAQLSVEEAGELLIITLHSQLSTVIICSDTVSTEISFHIKLY